MSEDKAKRPRIKVGTRRSSVSSHDPTLSSSGSSETPYTASADTARSVSSGRVRTGLGKAPSGGRAIPTDTAIPGYEGYSTSSAEAEHIISHYTVEALRHEIDSCFHQYAELLDQVKQEEKRLGARRQQEVEDFRRSHSHSISVLDKRMQRLITIRREGNNAVSSLELEYPASSEIAPLSELIRTVVRSHKDINRYFQESEVFIDSENRALQLALTTYNTPDLPWWRQLLNWLNTQLK